MLKAIKFNLTKSNILKDSLSLATVNQVNRYCLLTRNQSNILIY